MIDTDKYEGLTNDGKWIGTDADDSVIYYDAERDWYATIALVQRDSDHYGSEDNPDIRLMVDAPLLLEEVKRLRAVLEDQWQAIADIATNMHAADASYMCGFIDDLWKVIE